MRSNLWLVSSDFTCLWAHFGNGLGAGADRWEQHRVPGTVVGKGTAALLSPSPSPSSPGLCSGGVTWMDQQLSWLWPVHNTWVCLLDGLICLFFCLVGSQLSVFPMMHVCNFGVWLGCSPWLPGEAATAAQPHEWSGEGVPGHKQWL